MYKPKRYPYALPDDPTEGPNFSYNRYNGFLPSANYPVHRQPNHPPHFSYFFIVLCLPHDDFMENSTETQSANILSFLPIITMGIAL